MIISISSIIIITSYHPILKHICVCVVFFFFFFVFFCVGVCIRKYFYSQPRYPDLLDVGGLSEVKQILTECIIWPGKYPKLFSHCPLRVRSGVLLYGAPGTGKTLVAEIIANESNFGFVQDVKNTLTKVCIDIYICQILLVSGLG